MVIYKNVLIYNYLYVNAFLYFCNLKKLWVIYGKGAPFDFRR